MQWHLIILTGIFTLFHSLCLSQDSMSLVQSSPYFQGQPLNPESGRDAGYYKRNSNRAENDNKLREATLYGIMWLETEENLKKKKKAHEWLSEILPKALSDSEQLIETLLAETSEFKGEQTIGGLRRLKSIFIELIDMQNKHGNLASEWKVEKVIFPKDYHTRLKEVDQNLGSAIEQVAEGFYQQAMKLLEQEPSRRMEYLEVARILKKCRSYLPNYKEVESKYADCRQKATTRLIISDIKNLSSYNELFTSDMKKAIYGDLQRKLAKSPLDFFELVPSEYLGITEKYNVRYELEIVAIQLTKKYKEPVEKERKKAVGDEKSEQTITGKYIVNSKIAQAQIEVRYRIIDIETNEVLANNTKVSPSIVAWEDNWYTYQGNLEALKDNEKKDIKRKPKELNWPGNLELTQRAIHDINYNDVLADDIFFFAKAVGN